MVGVCVWVDANRGQKEIGIKGRKKSKKEITASKLTRDEELNERDEIGLKEMSPHCDSNGAAGVADFISYITFQLEDPPSK